MLILPDGIQIDMRWKTVSYIKGNNKLCFSIEPMLNCEAIIYFPSKDSWGAIEKSFSQKERLEIIFLFERIAWKRKVKVVIVDITPEVLSKEQDVVKDGSMESTQAGKKIEADALFDPGSPLISKQVNEIYISLEKKFAESVKGLVTVHKTALVEDSVFSSVILPALERNANAEINFLK